MSEDRTPDQAGQGISMMSEGPSDRLTANQWQHPDQQRGQQHQQKSDQKLGLRIRPDRINRLDVHVMVVITADLTTIIRHDRSRLRSMREHHIIVTDMPGADHLVPRETGQRLGKHYPVLGQQIGQKDQGNQQLGMCATHDAGHYHNPTQRLCKSL